MIGCNDTKVQSDTRTNRDHLPDDVVGIVNGTRRATVADLVAVIDFRYSDGDPHLAGVGPADACFYPTSDRPGADRRAVSASDGRARLAAVAGSLRVQGSARCESCGNRRARFALTIGQDAPYRLCRLCADDGYDTLRVFEGSCTLALLPDAS